LGIEWISNSQSPHFWGCEEAFSSQLRKIFKLKIFKTSTGDSNQILHNDKDLRVLFADGANMYPTNPRWWTGAILKNRKLSSIKDRGQTNHIGVKVRVWGWGLG